MVIVEVGDAANVPERVGDLPGHAVHHEDVRPIELDGQLTLHAGKRLVDVVLDGLGEVGGDAGNVSERGGHGRDQPLLVRICPLLARLEPDVELRVVGRLGIGAVVRGAELGHDHADFGKAKEPLTDLPHVRAHALDRHADGELDTHPQISLVELGEELLSEEAERPQGDREETGGPQDGDDGPAHAPAESG